MENEEILNVIKNMKDQVLKKDIVQGMAVCFEHGVFGNQEYEVQILLTKNSCEFIGKGHTSCDLKNAIQSLDMKGVNLSPSELKNRLKWAENDFNDALLTLLKKGDVLDVSGKIFPLESYNLY